MTLTAIVLDIGNVICEWNPQKLIASAFEDVSLHEEAMAVTIGHADWLQLDRGTLSPATAIKNACERSSLDPAALAAVYQNLPSSLAPLPDTVAAMHEVKAAGMPLYILSNMQKEVWDFMVKRDDFWPLVDKVILSCDCHLVKPEREIYEHLVNECDLEASSSVFIDDMAENIDAAIDYGLRGVHLTDRNRGGAVIRKLLQENS